MEYNIELRDLAKIDINNIIEFVFRFSFDISISKQVYDEIYSAIFSLNIFPARYQIFKDNIRVMTIKGKYRVFYEISEENKNIVIYRIFSSKQDYYNLI